MHAGRHKSRVGADCNIALSAKAESPTKCWAMWRPHELSEAPASKCAEDSEDRLRLQFSTDELSL